MQTAIEQTQEIVEPPFIDETATGSATSVIAPTFAPVSLTLGTVPEVESAGDPPATQPVIVPDAPLWNTDDAAWRAEVREKVCKPCEELISQKEAADKSIKQLIEDNYELLAWGRDHYGKQGQKNTSTIGWQEWIRQNMPCSVRYVNQVIAEIESRLKPKKEDQPDDVCLCCGWFQNVPQDAEERTTDNQQRDEREDEPDGEPTAIEEDGSVLPDDIPAIANTPDKIFELLEREYILSLEATFKLDTPQESRNAIQALAQRLCTKFIGDGKALVKIKLVEEEKRKKQ
jgi:hypothetical protein